MQSPERAREGSGLPAFSGPLLVAVAREAENDLATIASSTPRSTAAMSLRYTQPTPAVWGPSLPADQCGRRRRRAGRWCRPPAGARSWGRVRRPRVHPRTCSDTAQIPQWSHSCGCSPFTLLMISSSHSRSQLGRPRRSRFRTVRPRHDRDRGRRRSRLIARER